MFVELMQIRPYGFLLGLDRELLTRKEAYLADF